MAMVVQSTFQWLDRTHRRWQWIVFPRGPNDPASSKKQAAGCPAARSDKVGLDWKSNQSQ